MTSVTLSELRVTLARALRDPSNNTFSTDDLQDMLNSGISEVSRLCPQRFVEDISLVAGEVRYAIRGGQGNLLANWSFEEADADVLAHYTTVAQADPDGLLRGWYPSASTDVAFGISTNAKNGRRICKLKPAVGGSSVYLYQDVPVTADTTYLLKGYHWKDATGGLACHLSFLALDEDSVYVESAASWATTANAPVFRTGSYVVPSSGVSFIRVRLLLSGVQPATREACAMDAVRVVEADDATLVALESKGDIELARVEMWRYNSDDEAKFLTMLEPAAAQPVMSSGAGWSLWDGDLYIPDRIVDAADPATQFVRVFGYAPYDQLTSASQVSDLSDELKWAVLSFAQMEAYSRLINERDLFSQWQTRSGVSDVSPAALMNHYNIARDEWRRRSRALTRLRAQV